MKNCLLWIILLLYSCEYELNDEYYVEVSENVIAPVANVELNFASDTVYITSPSFIKFTINALNHKFHWIKFYINDNLSGTAESNSGEFQISPTYNNYSPGTYQIKIEAFSNSGTGSIADGVGAEGFLFTYTWIMIIEDDKYIASQFTKISREDGKLRLNWDLYKGPNFKKYVILKSIDRNVWHTVFEIYDQYKLTAFDPSYVGEKAIFVIRTYGDEIFYGKEVIYQDTIPRLSLENVGDKTIRLKWKSNFSENIAGYIITSKAKNEPYGNEQTISVPASDTSCLFQGKFGTITEFMLTVIPKQAPSYFNDKTNQAYYYSSKCNGIIGEKSFSLGMVHVPYGDYLIYRTINTLFLYDYNTRMNVDSLVFSNNFHIGSVSANGNYILGYENYSHFFLYDVSSGTKKTISFSQITGSLKHYYRMAISNAGTAVLSDERDLQIYDFINDSLIVSIDDIGYIPLDLDIAADGEYFSNGYNHFFKVNGDTIQQLPELYDLYFYGFNPCNAEEIIEYTPNGSLQFINISDRSISKSVPISCDVIHNIDFNAGKILGSTNQEFKVYDLTTGELVWTHPTFSQGNFSPHEFTLCKDVIYWIDGYLIYVQ